MAGSSRAIRLETDVRGDALQAFDAFVAAMDEHWAGSTPAGGWAGPRDIDIEPHAGGTLEAEVDSERLELGHITLWQPGHRLEADWREPDWPADVLTAIAVSFEPSDAETHVSVEHSGFEDLGDAATSIARRYETRWREVLGAVG
jgi:uncharacterized protein YndB with AHSA1/START domain